MKSIFKRIYNLYVRSLQLELDPNDPKTFPQNFSDKYTNEKLFSRGNKWFLQADTLKTFLLVIKQTLVI